MERQSAAPAIASWIHYRRPEARKIERSDFAGYSTDGFDPPVPGPASPCSGLQRRGAPPNDWVR